MGAFAADPVVSLDAVVVDPLALLAVSSVPVSSNFFPTWGLSADGLATSRYV